MNLVFKALSDPNRRKILRILAGGERSAGALADDFDLGKPALSHHFSVLKEAGLIRSRREGQQILYSLDTSVLQDLAVWTLDLIDTRSQQKEPKP